MRLLLPANDEALVFLNPLTLDNVTYRRVDEIRKNMDHFLHIQNGAILLNPLKVKRIPSLPDKLLRPPKPPEENSGNFDMRGDVGHIGQPTLEATQTLEKKRCRGHPKP